MIKKSLFLLLISVFFMGYPCVNFADEVTDVETPIVWDLHALTETMRDLLFQHCKVKQYNLEILSDFILSNPKRSIAEIAEACSNPRDQSRLLSSALFYYDKNVKNVECPAPGEKKDHYQQVSGTFSVDINGEIKEINKPSCQYYVEYLKKKQNEFNDYKQKYSNYDFSKPGLYVERIENNKLYRVVNYVKAKEDSNTNENSVYVVGGNTVLSYPLYSSDMFTNITTGGHTFGIYNHSYIYSNMDVTREIFKMAEQKYGPVQHLINSSQLFLEQNLDVKNVYCKEKKLQRSDQRLIDCHTNGVIFRGKIVTLEWLGHYLFGYRKAITSGKEHAVSDMVYEAGAALTQRFTSGSTDGQTKDDGALMKIQEIGYRDGKLATYFSNTQVSSPAEAIKLIKDLFFKIFGTNNIDINCPIQDVVENNGIIGSADGRGQQDYVYCYVSQNGGPKILYQFEFDDVTNKKFF